MSEKENRTAPEAETEEYRQGYEAGHRRGFMEGFHAGIRRVIEMLEGSRKDGGDHEEECAD
jgi:hypothetical protein